MGTCGRVDDPQAPIWSAVHLTNVEVLGGGTIAYDEAEDRILPHIHVTVGLKRHSATGHTSHLLSASGIQICTMCPFSTLGSTVRWRACDDPGGGVRSAILHE